MYQISFMFDCILELKSLVCLQEPFAHATTVGVDHCCRCSRVSAVRYTVDPGFGGGLARLISDPPISAMTGNFGTWSPHFGQYENVTLLGPPTMRGALIFSGSSHPKLVEGVCDRLGLKQGSATLGKFKNGETSVTIRMYSCTRAAYAL
jgi:hypothetical protein